MGGKLSSAARRLTREAAAAALRSSGLPALIRRRVAPDRVTLIMYHSPSPKVLDRHLGYLARRYTFIPLDVLVDAIHAGDWSAVPERGLVVTVDDGLRACRELGPVFARYGCRPTLYVCTAVVGTRRRFWFRAGPGDPEELKPLPNGARLAELKRRYGFEPTRAYDDEPQALSLEELRAACAWADVESHGRFHPILPTCDDQECEREIVGSREDLRSLTGREARHFSYPNGDFTPREVELVKQAGYRSARSMDPGWNGPETDPYHLRIAGAADDASVNMLAAQLSCVPARIRRLVRRPPAGFTFEPTA